MIRPTPVFAFSSRTSLTRWYGHVHLLPERALGQWFCLDRKTGKLLWERRHFRPTSIVGISEGIIVANETRSDGPWTFGFGCYGLSLETGDILWTSHRNGIMGMFARLLDFVPGFTNDLRDTPVCVEGGECVCASGRVLSVRDGRQVRRISKAQVKELGSRKVKSDAQNLDYGTAANLFTRVRVADGKWLSHKRASGEKSQVFSLHLLADDGAVLWSFAIGSTKYHMSSTNFFAYRFCSPFVYIIASEEPSLIPHPTKAHYVVPRATIFHVLTLDLIEERIAQDQAISERKFATCRIEDADERGLLISGDNKELMYFERTSGCQRE